MMNEEGAIILNYFKYSTMFIFSVFLMLRWRSSKILLFQAIVQLFRGTNWTSRMGLNLEYHGNHRVLIRRLRVQFKLGMAPSILYIEIPIILYKCMQRILNLIYGETFCKRRYDLWPKELESELRILYTMKIISLNIRGDGTRDVYSQVKGHISNTIQMLLFLWNSESILNKQIRLLEESICQIYKNLSWRLSQGILAPLEK